MLGVEVATEGKVGAAGAPPGAPTALGSLPGGAAAAAAAAAAAVALPFKKPKREGASCPARSACTSSGGRGAEGRQPAWVASTIVG
jgi:hypothetical protein